MAPWRSELAIRNCLSAQVSVHHKDGAYLFLAPHKYGSSPRRRASIVSRRSRKGRIFRWISLSKIRQVIKNRLLLDLLPNRTSAPYKFRLSKGTSLTTAPRRHPTLCYLPRAPATRGTSVFWLYLLRNYSPLRFLTCCSTTS